MGHVRVPILLRNPLQPDLAEARSDATIDAGATWTTVPRSLAERLELLSMGPVTGRTASGVVTLEQSFAEIQMEGKRGVGPIMISDELDTVLVGVLTLETLALAVDPLNQRLVETELYLL